MEALNPHAAAGFSNSTSYDKHRPSYPVEAVNALLSALNVRGVAGARLLDLAAGTGKFTELLADRSEAFAITAVEPHEQMRSVLAGKKLRHVAVDAGSATQIPLGDRSVHAVIIAQAFHWFANRNALHEIARVLQPGGSLGLIWNIEDYNQSKSAQLLTRWEAKLNDILWSLEDDQPRFRHEKWQAAFDEQLEPPAEGAAAPAKPFFTVPLNQREFEWTVWLQKNALWDRFNTLSQVAVLEGDARERVRKLFDDAINGDDVETNASGEVALHGRTYVVWTSKAQSG